MSEDGLYPTDAILREAAQQSFTDGGRIIAGEYMDGRVYLAFVNMDERHAFCVTHLDWHQACHTAASLIYATEVALIRNGWDGKQTVRDVWQEVQDGVMAIVKENDLANKP